MTVTLQVFEGKDVFEQHADSWQALLDRSPEFTFFQSPDWLIPWAKHEAGDRRLFLVVAERDGRWIGGLPLALGPGNLGRWKMRKLEFAGAPWFNHIEIPAADDQDRRDTLQALLDWSRKQMRSWTALELSELAHDGPTRRIWKDLCASQGNFLFEQQVASSPTLDLEAFHQAGGKFSKNLRSQLNRSRRRLEEEGALEMRLFLPQSSELDRLFEECLEIEQGSWKGEQGTGIMDPQGAGAFFRELWQRLAPKQQLAMATLRVDGRLLAYHWGFKEENRFHSYTLAHRPEYNQKGPGTLLQHHMVMEGQEAGFRFMDASRGAIAPPHLLYRYKGPVREHFQTVLYRSSPKGSGLRFLRHSVLPKVREVKAKIKKNEEPAGR
ncbi:MAG: GNAT family N-acetyltransferase [Planctomycetota bacterium]|nr:MAG: GNAT family N-acetyltransferase [Planctomycetota bacterium]